MNRKIIGILIVIALVAVIFFVRMYQNNHVSSPAYPSDANAENASAVVTEFGKKMQTVSLLAPAADVKNAMDENYSPYVAPELLVLWEQDPENAPGRMTSSPWPDHIVIDSSALSANGVYQVKGRVIEMTSTGPADEDPVTVMVSNVGGTWMISGWGRGE